MNRLPDGRNPSRGCLAPVAVLATLFLFGCDTESDPRAMASPGTGTAVGATSMEVVIESPAPNLNDGLPTTMVTATVFIPEHFEGETYPVILHGNRWSGSRTSRADVDAENPEPPFSTEEYYVVLDQHVETLWKAGFAVISFDQRGCGRDDDGDDGTADGVHASLDFEVRDAIAVLDWAVDNLDLTMDGPDDPRVGMIGGSYGANLQNLVAAVDGRIDAIIPGGAWHGMRSALAPNGVIKKGYSFGLLVLGLTDNIEFTPDTEIFFREIGLNPALKFAEEISAHGQVTMDSYGLNFFADNHVPAPEVDALLIHSSRDILLNLNEAIDNFDYLSSGGGDVRILASENGHNLAPVRSGPGAQGPRGVNGCGPIDVLAVMVDWFDAKLRGNDAAISTLPRLCLSLDDQDAAIIDAIPRGSSQFQVSIPAGTRITPANNNYLSPADQALFVPLGFDIESEGLVLLGQPQARLTVNAVLPGVESVAFVGLGIRRNGAVVLVDDQVIPIRSSDSRTGEQPETMPLAAVGEKLQIGDELGVLLFAAHDQFENEARSNWASNTAEIAGVVEIPISSPAILTRQ